MVANGAIWGRVLTSTGINFGTNGFIVGVRGTSLSLSKNATTTELAIVDSVKPANATTAEIRCLGMSGASFPAKKYSMTSVANTVCPANLPQSTDAIPLYTASPWIQKNTLTDIAYLADLSGTLAGAAQVAAATELSATVPATVSASFAAAVCPQGSSKMLWKSLEKRQHEEKRQHALCQDSSLVAFADFTKGDMEMHTPTKKIPTTGTNK